jgi:SAM-dependent methyltransferase
MNRLLHKTRKTLQRWKMPAIPSELYQAQQAVSACSPNPYYLVRYRVEETRYWTWIPVWLVQDFTAQKPEVCLDIGCGYGTLSTFMRLKFNSRVYCTNIASGSISPELVEKFDLQHQVNNIELEPLPWETTFDVVLMTEVLEHFNFHPLSTLMKIRESMKENAPLYLTTPDAREWGRAENIYSDLSAIPQPDASQTILDAHVYLYTGDELVGLLEEAGFKVHRLQRSPGNHFSHLNLMAKRSR